MVQSIFTMSPFIREAGIQGNDDWPTQYRRIYDYQFFYCFRGIGQLEIDGLKFKLKKGSLFIIPPDVPHSYERDKQNPCDCYWFHCDLFWREDADWPTAYYNELTDYVNLFASRLLYPEHVREKGNFLPPYQLPYYVQIENDKDMMEHHFLNIYNLFISGSQIWRIEANAAFYSILGLLFAQQSNVTKQSSKVQNQVNLMKVYMHKNYFKKIKVNDITKETVYNPDYAAKLFREVCGLSITEYLTNYRIGKAKRLLLDLDLSIADVAFMCGFNDQSYFSAVIKAREGVTPSQLRDSIVASVKEIKEAMLEV